MITLYDWFLRSHWSSLRSDLKYYKRPTSQSWARGTKGPKMQQTTDGRLAQGYGSWKQDGAALYPFGTSVLMILIRRLHPVNNGCNVPSNFGGEDMTSEQ